MESNFEQQENVNIPTPSDTPILDGTNSQAIAKLPPAQPQNQFEEIGAKVSVFLASLPEYVGTFFQRYKQPLITLGLIFATIVAVRILLAVLDAVNGIPLISPLLELVGIGYTVWFVSRYLLKASTRRELGSDVESIKKQILGKEAEESFN